MSFPRDDPTHSSVNDQINIEDFRCDWGTFNDIRSIVINAPPGTEAATLDVDSAFRCCPIIPSQQSSFVIHWNNRYYVDHNAPFGATSAGGVFGRAADAKSAILESKKIGPSKNWVDDFVFFRFPLLLLTSRTSFLLLPHRHLFSRESTRMAVERVQNETVFKRIQIPRLPVESWAKSAVKRYSSSIRQYIRFCDMEGIPEHLRFPADEFVLCAFTASSAGIYARSTPRNQLSALKAWHVAHNLSWNGSSRLRYVLNGVHNLTPRGSKRPPRPPVSAKMIIELIQHLDFNSPLDIAIATCAAMAFWGQCRLGELLPSSPHRLIIGVIPITFELEEINSQSLSYSSPSTHKNSPQRAGYCLG